MDYRGWMSDPYMGHQDWGGLLDPQGYGRPPQNPSATESPYAPSSWAGSPYDGSLWSPPQQMRPYEAVGGMSRQLGMPAQAPPQSVEPQTAAPSSPTRDAILNAMGTQRS